MLAMLTSKRSFRRGPRICYIIVPVATRLFHTSAACSSKRALVSSPEAFRIFVGLTQSFPAMRVITFALATTSILQPCTESVLEKAALTATVFRGPTVVPAFANGHDDTSFSRSLRSNVQGIINVDGGLLGEGVVNRIESAISSGLVEQEQAHKKLFDALKAMFPEHVMDEALLKSSDVETLVNLAHNEAFLKASVPLEGEAHVATSLAGLLSSQDKKVQDFAEKYLEVLILRWAEKNTNPADVLKSLGLHERDAYHVFNGDSAADVVLKKYCARAKPKEPDLYYKLISDAYGGPKIFLGLASTSILKLTHLDRCLEIIEATMRVAGVDNSKQKEFLEHYVTESQSFKNDLAAVGTPTRDQAEQLVADTHRRINFLISLVDEIFKSSPPLDHMSIWEKLVRPQ